GSRRAPTSARGSGPRRGRLTTRRGRRTGKSWPSARPPSKGAAMRVLEGHTGPVRCLAYSPDGKALASGGDDHSVRLWEVASGRAQVFREGLKDPIRALAFNPDGRRLGVGVWDGRLRVWPVSGRGRKTSLTGDGSGIWSLAFSPDGSALAAGFGN